MVKRISSIIISFLLLASLAQAQTTTIRGTVKGSSTAQPVTSTAVDSNHTGLDVNIVGGGGSGGTASNFSSAFPATGTAVGFSNGTNMVPGLVDASGYIEMNCKAGCSAAGDSAATGSLNALNAAVTLAIAGDSGAAVEFASGTLSGATVLAQVSTDGGTTWSNAVFTDPISGAISTSLSNPSASQYGILWPTGGVSHVRVTVSVFTSGSVTANVRATANNPSRVVYGSDGTNIRPVQLTSGGLIKVDLSGTAANGTAVKVDGSGVTQPVSGTVTANAGSGTFTVGQATGSNLHVVCDSGCGGAASFNDNSAFTFGTTAINNMGAVVDDVSTNTVTENNGGHVRMSTNAILYSNPTTNSGTSLFPSPAALADATANPTLTQIGAFLHGYNGTTWDRLKSTTANGLAVDVTRVQGSVAVTGTFWQATQPVSGTITANIGTSGSLALDASVTGLQVAQGSTTSGQSGSLMQGAVTTSAPTYTTGKTDPLSLTTAGALRVDGSGVTQPVSISGNQAVNVAQMNGVTVTMGNGVSGTGVQRVAIASDNTAFSVNAIQSGTWTVLPGNTANTTPWLVQAVPGTSNGASTCNLQSAATTNATNCKNAAGTLYGYELINTTSTVYYLRLYNSSAAPTCSSSTNFVRSIPIPQGSTAGAGVVRDMAVGEAYGTGLSFCLTGGGSSTDNTNAATGVYASLLYK